MRGEWKRFPRAMNDDELLSQFENCTYPFSSWDHRTHARLAFLYLREHGFDGALERLRKGIKAYNATNNVPESELSGYNETTTHAFLRLIQATMVAYGEMFPTPDSETFCDTHPQLLSKHILRLFYSPQQRMHPDAKTEFVEPDLAPLPTLTDEIEQGEFTPEEGVATAVDIKQHDG